MACCSDNPVKIYTGFSSEFDQDVVSDNFVISEHGGFDDDSCFRNFDVEKERNHCCSSVSTDDGVQIEEVNYIHDHDEEFEGCESDGRSSEYTNEFSPSGFFVGQIRKRRRIEEVYSESNSDDYTNEFSPSGFFVGKRIRAKKADDADADAKSESSVEFYGHDNAVCDDATSDFNYIHDHEEEFEGCGSDGRSSDYTNEFSPSGFFVGQIRKRRRFEQVESGSNSDAYTNEFSPSGFFVGKKIRAKGSHSDAKTESSVGFYGASDDASDFQEVQSNFKTVEYDGDTNSEDSVAVTDEQFQENHHHNVTAEVLVAEECDGFQSDATSKQKLVSKQKRKGSPTVKEVEESCERDAGGEQRQIVVRL